MSHRRFLFVRRVPCTFSLLCRFFFFFKVVTTAWILASSVYMYIIRENSINQNIINSYTVVAGSVATSSILVRRI